MVLSEFAALYTFANLFGIVLNLIVPYGYTKAKTIIIKEAMNTTFEDNLIPILLNFMAET